MQIKQGERKVAQTTLICPECFFQKEVPAWEDGGNIAFCPICTNLEGQKLRTLMSVEMFVHIEFQKQLQALIYCRDCRHIAQVGTLLYNGPSDDLNSETCCPNCYSVGGPINASCIKFCQRCGERQARKGEALCNSCGLDSISEPFPGLGEYDDDWDMGYLANLERSWAQIFGI